MRYVLDAIVNWHGFPLALATKDDKTGVIQTYEHRRASTRDYHDVKVVDQDCTWGDLFSMYPPEDISRLDTDGLLGYFEGRGYTSYASVDPSDYKTYWMQYNRYKNSNWFDILGSNTEDRSLTPNLLNGKAWKPVIIPFSSQTLGVAVIAVENTVWHYIDYFVITYNELTGYSEPVPFEYPLRYNCSQSNLHFVLRKGELNISMADSDEHYTIHLEKDQLYHCINYEHGHRKHYVVDYDSKTDLPVIRPRSNEMILQPNGVASYLRRVDENETLVTTPLHVSNNKSVLCNLSDEEKYCHILKTDMPTFKHSHYKTDGPTFPNQQYTYTDIIYTVTDHKFGRFELRRDERGNANYYDKVGNNWASENQLKLIGNYVNKEEYLKEAEWLTKLVIDKLKPNSIEAINQWRMRSLFLGKPFPPEKPKGYFIGTGADLGKLIHNGCKSLFELFRPLESYSWELYKLCLVDNKLYWVYDKTSISLISATYSLIGLTSELEDTDMADMSWFLISIMS